MKFSVVSILVLFTTFQAHATTPAADSNWSDSSAQFVVEAGTMVVSGAAAEDLYEALLAEYKVTDSSARQEVRVKSKGQVSCRAELIRGIASGGRVGMGAFEIVDADCKIKLNKGTVAKE